MTAVTETPTFALSPKAAEMVKTIMKNDTGENLLSMLRIKKLFSLI